MAIVENVSLLERFDTSGDNSEPVSLRAMRIYAVHGDIYKRFVDKYAIADIHCYEKLRNVASLQDIATLFILRSTLEKYFDSDIFSDLFENGIFISPEEKKDCDRVRSTLTLITDEVEYFLSPSAYNRKHNVLESGELEDATSFLKESAELPYKVMSTEASLYIVVEERFLESMEDKTSKLGFISAVLKALYAAMPINAVNRSSWYALYLKALQKLQ